jgi:subtilisin family serine protease
MKKLSFGIIVLLVLFLFLFGCPMVPTCGDEICQTVPSQYDESNPDSNYYCPQDCGGTQTHLECRNNACVSVDGAGTNTCSTNADCAVQTHLECRNNACVSVDGAGENQCTVDSDCVQLSTCKQQGGNYCGLYGAGPKCEGTWLSASDTGSCCTSDCYDDCATITGATANKSKSTTLLNISTVGKNLLGQTGPQTKDIEKEGSIFSVSGSLSANKGKVLSLQEFSERATIIDASSASYIVELSIEPLNDFIEKDPSLKAVENQLKTSGYSSGIDQFKSAILTKKAAISLQKTTVFNSIKSINPNIIKLKEYSWVLNGFSVKLPNNVSIVAIKAIPGVKAIYPNLKVKATMDDVVPLFGMPVVWQMNSPLSGKLDGNGVKVGIIDTGVDYTHADFGSCTSQQVLNKTCAKVAGGKDLVNNDDDPMDDQGHGTHVAGIIAANGTAGGQQFKGMAPNAKIYGIKVLDGSGSGSFDTVIAGIDWAMDPNGDDNPVDHLDVINLSLGGPGDPDDPVSQAIDRAASNGVIPVIAAGNSWNFFSIGSPGAARKAITVGATFDKPYSGGYWDLIDPKVNEMAPFSSKGPVISSEGLLMKPDIVAPGALICSTRFDSLFPEGSHRYYKPCIDDKHVLLAGTSMATPVVAGLAALVRQMHPDWNVSAIKSAIVTTGTQAIYSGTDLSQTGNTKELVYGGGVIKPISSVNPRLVFSDTSLSYNFDEITSVQTKALRIRNVSPIEQKVLVRVGANLPLKVNNASNIQLCIQPGQEQQVTLSLSKTDLDLRKINYSIISDKLQIDSNNGCSASTSTPVQFQIPVLYSKSKKINVTLTMKQYFPDQNIALVYIGLIGLDEPNGNPFRPADEKMFVIENLSTGAQVTAEFRVFNDLNKIDAYAIGLQFNGQLTSQGWVLVDKDLSFVSVARKLDLRAANRIELNQSDAIKLQDNSSELLQADSLTPHEIQALGSFWGWIVGDNTSCKRLVKGFDMYYFQDTYYKKYYAPKKLVLGSNQNKSIYFANKILALKYDYNLNNLGQKQYIYSTQLQQTALNINGFNFLGTNNPNFGINIYEANWFMLITLGHRVKPSNTILLKTLNSPEKGMLSIYQELNWNYAPGNDIPPEATRIGTSFYNATRTAYRVGALPPSINFLKRPIEIKSMILDDLRSTLVIALKDSDQGILDILDNNPQRTVVSITKPDRTVVRAQGIRHLVIYCDGSRSSIPGFGNCIDGTYSVDWNLSNAIVGQESYYKHFDLNRVNGAWILPMELKRPECTSNSIIGSVDYDSVVGSNDSDLMKGMLNGTVQLPQNICCIDADNDKRFTLNDLNIVQNFLKSRTPIGNVNKFCSQIS